ncbi:hypothetical protein [Pseudogracilibacillus sp. SO30301A]|uniref:hypothetical protein n=1 Tax=Pseudogracilibacillus sp. SO30301A TaxID=3098291 RepID=UPI00300E6B05
MNYIALVKRLDPLIEEEVTIEINGVEFTGFASICPYEIEIGKSYPVFIGFTVLEDLKIYEIREEKKELERIASSYEYYIRGVLHEDTIDAGIVLTDEDDYFSEYTELIGRNVEMKVARISIDFLRASTHL